MGFMIKNGVSYGGLILDDTKTSDESTWSSKKIQDVIDDKIVDKVESGNLNAVTSNAVNSALVYHRLTDKTSGGTDFNTLVPPYELQGSWYYVYGNSSNPNTNAPADLNTINFVVHSMRAGGRIKQIAYHFENSDWIYVRSRHNDGTWFSWHKFTVS